MTLRAGARPTREEVFELLDAVKDPEVPVLSVVELGIVRDARVSDEGVTVVITPTYSGCPAMHAIEAEIVAALAGLGTIAIETVFAPAWTTEWMSEGAKRKLVEYGIAAPGRAEQGELVPLMRRAESVPCPYCGARNTELRSEFGTTACKSIRYCPECRQPFEQFKAI